MFKSRTILASVLGFFLLSVSTLSFASELGKIKSAIKTKKAKWIAEETSVSGLSPELRKLRVSLLKNGGEDAGDATLATPLLSELPSSLDWRNLDYVTPPRDQGDCGSCWAFATTGALESYGLRNNIIPVTDSDLSEQILVSCSGTYRAGSCSGGYIDRASSFIRDTGLPEEACYPYTATNSNCRSACGDWNTSTHRIGSWSYVATTSPAVEAIKNALSSHGPLVTTMDVYTDFFYYKSGIYRYSYGQYEGGHAVLIVGYNDDAGGYFIVKNSWGTGWGEGGFFNIAYSEINPTVQFGYWTIAYLLEAPCTYSISPTSKSFPKGGGSGSINVSAGAGCSWTAVSNASWVTINSGSSGAGNGAVQYVVLPNSTKRTRSATITVAGKVFNISQKAR